MEPLYHQLLALLTALWWPFCRCLALMSAAPVIGDGMVPLPLRVLLSLVMAVVLLPVSNAAGGLAAMDPFSLAGIIATAEQAIIGAAIGLALHLAMSAISLLGYLVSSQMGLAMAVMNDPINGSSSDVISNLLVVLTTVAFFAIDGHLMLFNVLAASFKAWPIGGGLANLSLQTIAANGLQIGFGFLNRVAPALNLFSLGFSVVTIFGLFMLAFLVRSLPGHYINMSQRVLEMLQTLMRGVPHG